MKFRVTFLDGVDLLIDADKEVDAVRKAKELKDKLSVVNTDYFTEKEDYQKDYLKDEDYGKYSNKKKVNDASQKTILDGDYIFIGQEPTGEVFIQLQGDPIYDNEKSKFSNFLREVEKVKKYF